MYICVCVRVCIKIKIYLVYTHTYKYIYLLGTNGSILWALLNPLWVFSFKVYTEIVPCLHMCIYFILLNSHGVFYSKYI